MNHYTKNPQGYFNPDGYFMYCLFGQVVVRPYARVYDQWTQRYHLTTLGLPVATGDTCS